MDAVMAQPSMLDSGHEAGRPAPPAPAPSLPPAAPSRAPLTAPAMPSMAPLLAPPAGPNRGLSAPAGLLPPSAKPLVPTLGAAPALAPLPTPSAAAPVVLPEPDEVPAWARAVPTTEIAVRLPATPPTPPAPPVALTAPGDPEPVRLAAALDAAGAPVLVPTSQTVAGRRAAELRAGRRKRAQRIKVGMALALLAVGALAGPPLARWIADQVNGNSEIAPESPAVVNVDVDSATD